MTEKKKTDLKEGFADLKSSFTLNLQLDSLKTMTSGSCIITSTIPPSDQKPERIAVCKEGNTIKIFKIVEEKK
jgi:hypothetical protein